MARGAILGAPYHLVERKDTVTWLELRDIGSNLVDNAGDVVTSVARLAHPLWQFPVLWVRPAHNHLDDQLVVIRLRDG